MQIRKLHTRIVVSFAALLLIVQACGLFLINGVLTASANHDIQQHLVTGNRLFNLLREDNSRRLIQAASILSADFAFREAVVSADRGTIVSALDNHGSRIKADVMFLAGLDHALLADTLGANRAEKSFPFPDLINSAERQGQASAVVLLDGHLYQLVVVPVRAPLPIAWLALGFVIDDNFAKGFRSLSGLEVSFMTRSRSDNTWQLLATTLPAAHAAKLAGAMPGVGGAPEEQAAKLLVGDEDYLALISGLNVVQPDRIVVAVLQESLRTALEPLRRLQLILLVLSGISLLATLIAGYQIARSITKPISELGSLAHKIEQGDYTQSIALDREDEIGQLSSAFNHMTEGISSREAKITELAYRDSLTKLPNRTLFSDRMDQAIKTAKRTGQNFTILIMDLDRFKEVNDILGHHIGDLLLQEIATRLQSVVMRDADTVARLGGDEFAVLLQASDVHNAQIVARKLLDTLEQPILLEGQQVIAGGSIGIAMYPDHGEEINTLLRHADQAMYAAKRNSSDYAIFDASLDGLSQQHLSLMAELRHAVERDELELYYQPKLNIASGEVTQVEALIRWIHPGRGVVPPDHFIPFAENTGYIRTITRWVIERALCQRKAWQDLPLTISINISARDLLNAKLPALFSELLKAHGASPHWLALEITESAIMADPQGALDILNELYAMGFRMSVDDFGTGYSSLAYLKKLPVDELKIDKSFISDMVNNLEDAMIVRSTIDLGHNMGLKVVAEGVEDKATLEMLQSLGCDLIQGYYVSRPLTAQALEQWLANSPWQTNRE